MNIIDIPSPSASPAPDCASCHNYGAPAVTQVPVPSVGVPTPSTHVLWDVAGAAVIIAVLVVIAKALGLNIKLIGAVAAIVAITVFVVTAYNKAKGH